MDKLARLRQAGTGVAKVQRRIWLLQATFWLAVALGGIAATIAVGRRAWRRLNAASVVNDAPVASPNRAAGTQAAPDHGKTAAVTELPHLMAQATEPG